MTLVGRTAGFLPVPSLGGFLSPSLSSPAIAAYPKANVILDPLDGSIRLALFRPPPQTEIKPVRRVLIANRGEAASRFLAGAKAYALERGEPIEVIVIYTEMDAKAPYVPMADKAIEIRPEQMKEVEVLDDSGRPEKDAAGNFKKRKLQPYEDLDLIVRIAKEQGCDSVWPGWGWLSEKEELPDALVQEGIRLIGPTGDMMRAVGDKIGAKQLAQEVGVPVTPWSQAPTNSLEEAIRCAYEIGYPVVLKARAGGGGGGIRFAMTEEELVAKYQTTRDEAGRKFKNNVVFVEKAIVKSQGKTPRHVEVQIFGDVSGDVIVVGDRDCTIQRKNQKVVEEAPAPDIPDAVRREIHEAAVRLAKKVGYVGAGTVEFLYIPETWEFFFMEMNTRLQVEHTITEVVTGIDLVREQIRIAEGYPLSFKTTPAPRGVAFQSRIYAEDPERDFSPTGGFLQVFRPPGGPGIRNDLGVRSGITVPAGFDPMIAKLISHGPDRQTAMDRMRRALSEYAVGGLQTNIGLLQEIFGHADFRQGSCWTKWLDDWLAKREPWNAKPFHAEAIITAAVLAKKSQEEAYTGNLLKIATKGRLAVLPPRDRESRFEFRLYGHIYSVKVFEVSPGHYHVAVGGRTLKVSLTVEGSSEYRLLLDGQSIRVIGSEKNGVTQLALSGPNSEGSSFLIEQRPTGDVRAPLPGTIRMLNPQNDPNDPPVKQGDVVHEGQVIAMIEAMKVEDVIRAPVSGTLEEFYFTNGQTVREGDRIAKVKIDTSQQPPLQGPPIRFETRRDAPLALLGHSDHTLVAQAEETLLSAPNPLEIFRTAIDFIRQALLGFDPLALFSDYVHQGTSLVRVPSRFSEGLFRVVEKLAEFGRIDASLRTREIDRVLRSFLDVEILFRKGLEDGWTDSSPADCFWRFLRDRKAGGEFEKQLKIVLSHYGVTSLEPSQDLDRALTQILIAHDEAEPRREMILRFFAIVDSAAGGEVPDSGNGLPSTLELFSLLDGENKALVSEAEKRLFLLQEARLARMSQQLAQEEIRTILSSVGSGSVDKEVQAGLVRRMALLPTATGPHRAVYLLGRNREKAEIASRAWMERCYGGRHLIGDHDLEWDAKGPITILRFQDGKSRIRRKVVGITVGEKQFTSELIGDALSRGYDRLGTLQSLEETDDNVLEVAFGNVDVLMAESENLAEIIVRRLASVPVDLLLKRVTVTAYDRHGRTLRFNFYRDTSQEGRLIEAKDLRHLHPYQAELMELWRYRRHWHLEKIYTPWDNHFLFLATSREGGQRRLLTYSFVNQLTPLPDDSTAFREVDLAFGEAVHSIRTPLEGLDRKDPLRKRLEKEIQQASLHRIHLIVRPPVTLTRDAIAQGIKRLFPRTRRLDIDQTTLRIPSWRGSETEPYRQIIIGASFPGGTGLDIKELEWASQPGGFVRPRTEFDRYRSAAWRRGVVYPYEYLQNLVSDSGHGPGNFTEFDIEGVEKSEDPLGRERVRYNLLTAKVKPLYERYPGDSYKEAPKVVFGLLTRKTERHPGGITVMQIVNDPTTKLCSLEEPECARIIAAIDYAEEKGLEIDWKTTSSGAGISMTRGTENLDWTARVAARIGEFVKGGGVINILVDGTNIGAQSYWDSLATMTLQSGGLLIKTGRSFTALTGNEAQGISGSVASEDNLALAGARFVTAPIGQAQVVVRDIAEGSAILWQHHDLTWRSPGVILSPLWKTQDPPDRDITNFRWSDRAGREWDIGTILRDERKVSPFPVEALMEAIRDQDAPPPIPRWEPWTARGAGLIKVRETLVGGVPVMMIGVEVQSITREDEPPPGHKPVWGGSTLFPGGSKKMARAIRAANATKVRQDLAILANLAGFDGSAESLLRLQLEWGAQIEEAVREFRGKIVFMVTTRLHGGAYVVFSRVLNPNMTTGAVQGAFASVIGGKVAVQVIGELRRQVDTMAQDMENDPTIKENLGKASPEEQVKIRKEIRATVEERLAAVYDRTHSVTRAQEVGSIDAIVHPERIRPWIIDQLLQGREKAASQTEREIDLMTGAWHTFASAGGPVGIAVWEGFVRAASLGPFFPRMRYGVPSTLPPESTPGSSEGLDLQMAQRLGSGLRVSQVEVEGGPTGGILRLHYGKAESVMDVLSKIIQADAFRRLHPGVIITADSRAEGSGREGRRWEVRPDKDLLVSTWIKPEMLAGVSQKISLAVAAAVHETVAACVEEQPQIRWPDNVLIQGKKIAGVLIDSMTDRPGFNVGIGLNVNTHRKEFSGGLESTATSLFLSSGKTWDREELLRLLVRNLIRWTNDLNQGDEGWKKILDYVRRFDALIGKEVRIERGGRSTEGVYKTIEPDGGIVIIDKQGDKHFFEGGTLTVLDSVGKNS